MIRKVYIDLALRKTREYGASWLFKRAMQYAGIQAGRLINKPVCGPVLGTLLVTYRCNLHCEMCDMPIIAGEAIRTGKKEFDTDAMKEIISGFRSLDVPGIGFTGGEPLLREDIYDLLAHTRELGMITHLNTNGLLVGKREAKEIIAAGVDSVNVSLDASGPGQHDRIRGRSGAFESATAAIRALVAQRRDMGASIRIKTVAVIDSANIDEMPKLTQLARKLGVDCIEFIPRQPFTGNRTITPNCPTSDIGFQDLLNVTLQEIQDSGITIENSPAHLRLFSHSFAGLPSPIRCTAGFNSLALDCYGNVFPCLPWVNWGHSVGNIQDADLKRFWFAKNSRNWRMEVKNCRKCYLNCQTELNLLFDIKGRWRLTMQ